MNPRTTGILTVVAVILGAFVYFFEIEGEVERQAARDEDSKIHAGLKAADVDAISLVTLDGITARFEREEGRWKVAAPVSGRAAATSLDAMANALTNLPREGTVGTSDAEALEGFGLGEDAKTILFDIDGETRGLRIGRTTPVGGHRYVARLPDPETGESEVAYVASYRVNAFDRNLDDFRDRRIFTFEASEVRSFRLRWMTDDARHEIRLARDADAEWRLQTPIDAKADPEVMRDVISNLAYLNASGFVDGAALAGAEADALEETALWLMWNLDGVEEEQHARIAGPVPQNGKAVVRGVQRFFELQDGDTLYRIADERLEDYPTNVDAYRFKRLANFELALARRLELELRDDDAEDEEPLRIVAELVGSGWSSPGRALNPDRITALVRELSNLAADEIFADEMGSAELASLGLSPPRGVLRVEGRRKAGGPVVALADLRFGRLDPDRGLFVQRGDAPTIFLLSPETAAGLPISATRYRAEFEIPDAPTELDLAAESAEENEPISPVGAP